MDDIRSLPKEEKFSWYEKIGKDARGVEVEEHKSGFPAITIDYKKIHLLTDVFSVEEWFGKG
jgi:hypothetical protein